MEQLSALFDLASSYNTCRDVNTLVKTLTTHLGRRLEAEGVLVWLLDESAEQMVCRGRWSEAGVRFEPSPTPVVEGLLVDLLKATRARRLHGKEVNPAALLHLAENDRERVKTALYAPLVGSNGATGVIEIVNKRAGDFTPEDVAYVEEASRVTGRALETLRGLEKERQSGLATIERLTSLYDLGRTFNSTLELDDLLPILAAKIREIIGGQACNLWLIDSEANELYFSHQAGDDPTTREDGRVPLGEGVLGQVAQQGQARLVGNAASEPTLAARCEGGEGFRLETLMCSPLLKEEEVLGVIEVVNKLDQTAFDEDDLFFLTSISEQAAIALHNANLLEAERKMHELDALLAISKEITSTLNLDHVLTTVVHQAGTVVPFDRCAIGLFDRSRFILAAVSGEAEVPRTREMDRLRDLLESVAQQPQPVSADHYEEGWEVKPEGGSDQLVSYLDEQGYNGFYGLPLRDDQGNVGVLALLSGDAEFLSENHRETLTILGSQTTVAIRNARLYQEVPLVRLWQPLAERKQKLLAVTHGRWLEISWRVGLVALVLIAIPWKMRVATNASVVPAERRVVSAEIEGVIRRVEVHEGQKAAAGTVLAELDDSENRVKLAGAEMNLALARRESQEAGARRDLGVADRARLRAQIYGAEADLYREKVNEARLRAPISGVIVTPKVEEKVGKLLTPGDQFCELVDQDRMAVEMNVPETQEDLIRRGATVAIKLNAFPTQTFSGTVERLSAQTLSAEGQQFFVVRAVFDNSGGRARDGMSGQAKITAAGGWFKSGWYPVGYVFLRAPARWAWGKVWTWLP